MHTCLNAYIPYKHYIYVQYIYIYLYINCLRHYITKINIYLVSKTSNSQTIK